MPVPNVSSTSASELLTQIGMQFELQQQRHDCFQHECTLCPLPSLQAILDDTVMVFNKSMLTTTWNVFSTVNSHTNELRLIMQKVEMLERDHQHAKKKYGSNITCLTLLRLVSLYYKFSNLFY